MSDVPGRRFAAVAASLVAVLALGSLLTGCDAERRTDDPPGTIVMDVFESGALTGWQAVDDGLGGWSVHNADEPPDPAELGVPAPPQGTHAAATEPNGPGTHILYRDLRLDGRITLRLSVVYVNTAPFSSPETLAHDATAEVRRGASHRLRLAHRRARRPARRHHVGVPRRSASRRFPAHVRRDRLLAW